jgi:hypothetical protein
MLVPVIWTLYNFGTGVGKAGYGVQPQRVSGAEFLGR